jgi:hypothetical protein
MRTPFTRHPSPVAFTLDTHRTSTQPQKANFAPFLQSNFNLHNAYAASVARDPFV